MADKADRSVNARIARARFPVLRTLEEFDFTFQPGLSAVRVRELANLTFLDRATNVLFIGGPGVGKTHLAISLGLKACGSRRSVLFSSAEDLPDESTPQKLGHTAELPKRVNRILLESPECAEACRPMNRLARWHGALDRRSGPSRGRRHPGARDSTPNASGVDESLRERDRAWPPPSPR